MWIRKQGLEALCICSKAGFKPRSKGDLMYGFSRHSVSAFREVGRARAKKMVSAL